MPRIKVDGIYDRRTLSALASLGTRDLCFDFRPKSFNFLQQHVFLDLLGTHNSSEKKIYLHYANEQDFMVQKMIDDSQQSVNGVVRVKLYKGSVAVVGRKSETDSLFDENIATFEDDAGAYDQKDAAGFIKLNALRLRIAAQKNDSEHQ